MKDEDKTKEQLLNELLELRQRIPELETSGEECKRTEAALHSAHRKLRASFDAIQDNINIVDLDFNLTDVNEVLIKVFGLPSKESALGQKCFEVLKGRKDICPNCAVAEAYQTKAAAYRTSTPEDRVSTGGRSFEIFAYPIMDEQGNLFGAVEFARDITERKRAEQSWRESEERFRTIVNTALDSIFIKDGSCKYQFVNTAMERLFGVSASGLLGKTDEELFGKDAGKHINEVDRRVFQGEVVEEEYTKPVQGVLTTFHVIKVPMKDTDGNIVGLCGIARDITERKQAEQALRKAHEELERRVEERTADLAIKNKQLEFEITERKQAEEALRKAEEEKTIILETMSELVVYVDTNLKILWVNRAAAESVGLTADALVGSYCYKEWFQRSEPCSYCPAQNILETGQPQEGETYSPDGRVWHFRGYPVKDGNGEIVAIVEVLQDVTEHKRMEEEKKKLEAQLQQAQKMEAIGTLAGGIAHDFNNLLMGIQGNISLMLLDIDPAHPHYKRMESITKQVQSGAKLTQQLLGYARKGRYEVKPLNLNELVKESSEAFGRTRKEITIHRELAEDLSAVEADRTQIEQVLWNLYVNAADAMPGGGDLILKTMNAAHEDMKRNLRDPTPGHYVRLTVTDTGTGMDKKTMGRIFDPFFTTKELGRGTGLGLASAYGIINGHGGYIDVDSEKGAGTTFSIYLPVSEKKAQRTAKAAKQFVKGTGTVLLVDDEEVILEVGRELLKVMGYRALIARDGKEAIDVYRDNRDDIDIVVLDIVMPNMGGGEAYDRMKEINPNIKVLLSSGYSIEGQATEILERGCDGFIQKPFNIKALSHKIREILEKQ